MNFLRRSFHSSRRISAAVGDFVPSVTFKTRVRIGAKDGEEANPFDWSDKTSEDYFKGKRCVLFALPGAFTPTCSSFQLPAYEKHYSEMKSLGIDEVYCLSVNDAFVMRAWGIHQGLPESDEIGGENFKNVKLIPDGAALFTRGMGMSCNWTTERGFGERSWRYSMVVNDLKIEKLFVEGPLKINSKEDPYEVSDADTMLDYLRTSSSN
eukprot:g4295.t1